MAEKKKDGRGDPTQDRRAKQAQGRENTGSKEKNAEEVSKRAVKARSQAIKKEQKANSWRKLKGR